MLFSLHIAINDLIIINLLQLSMLSYR